nr:MAG TPA: hypothetical protein [Bacteriophage sp.]
MDITVLDKNLNALSIIDTYKSIIWTDRYNSYGDFEICSIVNDKLLNLLVPDNYLICDKSEHIMIIEKVQIKTDVDNGDTIIVSGRSLESILDRRIIWGQSVYRGKLNDVILAMLNECIIFPTDGERRINNFIWYVVPNESLNLLLSNMKPLEMQCTGDNLYDVITKLCNVYKTGFKISLNNNKQFSFQLYAGEDRSYTQTKNPYVIFSPSFDNLINSNYIEDKSPLKTITLIAGEGEGSQRKYASIGNGVGMDRRELFTDARDISSNIEHDKTMSLEDYYKLLGIRGLEKLYEKRTLVSFEGKTETTQLFKYDKDFFMGDIIQIENVYGKNISARIVEIIMSEDESGFATYPTLQTI